MKCHGELEIIVSVRRRIGDVIMTLSSSARSQLKRMQARASIEKVDVLDGRIALELELVRADLSKGITVKSEVRLQRAGVEIVRS
jgi:hypothetical protein